MRQKITTFVLVFLLLNFNMHHAPTFCFLGKLVFFRGGGWGGEVGGGCWKLNKYFRIRIAIIEDNQMTKLTKNSSSNWILDFIFIIYCNSLINISCGVRFQDGSVSSITWIFSSTFASCLNYPSISLVWSLLKKN